MSGQFAQPTPELFFATVNGYQQSAVIKGAIELDVFTAIAEGNTTAKELADKCDASERGMRILCDYLVTIGFLTKADGRYGLTPASAFFLDRRSPAYIGGSIEFLHSTLILDSFKDIAGAVRKGGPFSSRSKRLAREHNRGSLPSGASLPEPRHAYFRTFLTV